MPGSTADVLVHRVDDILPTPSPPPFRHPASASPTQIEPSQSSSSPYGIPLPQRPPPPPPGAEAATPSSDGQSEYHDSHDSLNAESQQASADASPSFTPSPAIPQLNDSPYIAPLSPMRYTGQPATEHGQAPQQPQQQQQERPSHDHLSADLSDIARISSAESTGAPGPTVIEDASEVPPSGAPEEFARENYGYHNRQSPAVSDFSASSPRFPPQAAHYKGRVSELSGMSGSDSSLAYRNNVQYAAAATAAGEGFQNAQQRRVENESPRPPSAAASGSTNMNADAEGPGPRLESPLQPENNSQSFLVDSFGHEQEGDSGLSGAIEETMQRVRNMDLRNEQSTPTSSQGTQSLSRRRSPDRSNSIRSSVGTNSIVSQELEYQPLHYHHAEFEQRGSAMHGFPRNSSSTSELSYGRTDSLSGRSMNHKPSSLRAISFVNLLNSPNPQPGSGADGEQIQRPTPGAMVSALGHKKTFDMYLANVKKTNDPGAQYEFAVFMINSSLTSDDDFEEIVNQHKSEKKSKTSNPNHVSKYELIREAKNILQRLADRGYPSAQYHLGDGYASGFFNKGKPDHGKAFTLFVAASKHGHTEAGYRAALCYEFGWGTTKDKAKAVQFYRQAASRSHAGAMLRLGKACMDGDMGQVNKYREGITWLKRAAEAANTQYNSAPYELGLLHETGFGDDVFKDPSYAAQLFTRAAELGHAEAAFRMGDAYEHGKLNCPVDPALSIHFYTTAAQYGHGPAMMALSAWYMLGSEGLLERDYYEAYEWAKRAAETGM